MILVISYSEDYSTDLVIEWLRYHSYPYVRLNSWDLIDKHTVLSISSNRILVSGKIMNLDQCGAVWYRRFISPRHFKLIAGTTIKRDCIDGISTEFHRLLGVLHTLLKDKYWLTSPKSARLNKFDVLNLARSIGLKVPDTRICNFKAHVTNWSRKSRLISKSLDEGRAITTQSNVFTMYTELLETNELESLPETFAPSLLQQCIEKQYEIRIFYIEGEFYSAAIFSQNDKTTRIDFRIYNWKRMNRFVPYRLPKTIERKLRSLMDKIGLNCGSIDLIRGTDGKYYFLEVNPNGQFGMVSSPCNLGLYKLVAETLIAKDEEYR